MSGELPLDVDDFRELAAFLESELAEPAPRTASEVDELRLRLLCLYGKLVRDPVRAALHAEQLLQRDEVDPRALEASSALLDESPVPPRVAELLSTAYERLGRVASEAGSLAVELGVAPPARRDRVCRRLADLRYGELGDAEGALDLLEQLVARDPGDDELRRRYLEIASSIGGQLRAAETLTRALGGPMADEIRARVGLDVGTLYLQEGELPRARNAFLEVVLVNATGPAALSAARRLLDLETDAGEPELVGPALEYIARADPDVPARQEAAVRLLALHAAKPLPTARVAVAYRALADSPRADEALTWLRSFYERRGDQAALSDVYRRQALRAGDPAEARALALRSIAVLPEDCGDERAIERWRWFVETFGTSREAHSELISLFERTERWEDLSRVLNEEADLARPGERAALLARLGDVRWTRLGDAEGSLAAFARALSVDPSNEAAQRGSEALMRRALRADPSSPDLLYRLDQLLADREPPSERVARYESALQHGTDPNRRQSLMHTIAAIRKDSLGDLPGAMQVWRRILAEAPADGPAYRALIDASEKLEDVGIMLDAINLAREALPAHERHAMTLRAVLALVRRGDGVSAAELCRDLFDEPRADPTTLRAIAEAARAEDNRALYRRALELLAAVDDADAKKYALERLGDLLFDAGDQRAAVESWKPAARLCEGAAGEQERAQHLYERVLEVQPGDRDAAERLVEIYARSKDWLRLPEVARVLIRSDEDGRASRALLTLEPGAIGAGAVDEYVSLLDEMVSRLGKEGREGVPDLKRARARALRSDPARLEEAARALRELIEEFENETDIADFESFIESRSSAEERHVERRWLYEWRASHGARPADILTEWAKAEEEQGEPEAAIAVYRRITRVDSGRSDAFEAMCRLKLLAGDFVGGLEILGELGDPDRATVTLRMAHLLLDELGHPAEAAAALAPLLGLRTPVQGARQMVRRLLRDLAVRDEVVVRLDQVAEAGGPSALRIFEFLVEAREETAARGDLRRRWFQRIVELAGDRAAALTVALRGALEMPDAMPLWDAAEKLSQELKTPEPVARAYHRVLVEKGVSADLVEALAQRMAAFEGESPTDPSRLVDALKRTLEVAPSARWALDRVKLALGSQARWDELFRLYDGAIAAARNDVERGELLDEAAFAARDLAGEPDRAITYLELIHVLRPDDAVVEGSLERIYERKGRKIELIDLLSERLEKAAGLKLRELRGRIASLRLDLGDAEQAILLVERMLEDDGFVPQVIDLLERVTALPPATSSVAHGRAIELLRSHYASLGRADDVVRVAKRQLAVTSDPDRRRACMRDLVTLRLVAAGGAPGIFARVTAQVESDVADDPQLASVAYRALFLQAIQAWKRAASGTPDATVDADAEDGAWEAIQRLKTELAAGGEFEAAFRLLSRVSQFPFAHDRRRALVRDAALLCADRLGDRPRAIRIFSELFDEDAGDAVASASFERFVELLDTAGEHAKLACLWEERGVRSAGGGIAAEESACWQQAAALWERQGEWGRAITAHRRGAALGAEGSFEALARIHATRAEWSDAAEALEWLQAHSPSRSRVPRALRLAEAYTELGEGDRARACLEEALDGAAETNDRNRVCERLLDLYRRDGVWSPLARLLAAESRRVVDPERKLALVREASELLRWQLDDLAGAAALLESAVAWAPDDGSLRLSLADVLEALQRWDQVVPVLNAQIAWYRDGRSKDRAISHHRLARALVHCGQPEEALAQLRLATEMHPSHPAILDDLGRVALDVGQLDLSESTYRVLLLALQHPAQDLGAPSPRRAEVLLDLSEVATRKGDGVRARDLVDSAFELALEDPEDPEWFERALAARGRSDLLARAIERRVERAPTLAARAVALGDLVDLWTEHLGRAEDLRARILVHAERVGRDLENDERVDVGSWTALCSVYASVGDRERTATILQAAIARTGAGPERARLRVSLARIILEDTTRQDDAIAVLSAAYDDAPTDLGVAEVLSDLLERNDRVHELVSLLERRLQALVPTKDAAAFLDTAWRLGSSLERVGRKRDALPVYESMLEWQPGDGERVRALASRLEDLGSKRLGDCIERLIELDTLAAPALAERLLELRDSQGDVAGAARALRIGFSADPGNAAFRDRLLLAYRTSGDHAEMLKVLDGAIRARPGDGELLSLRAGLRDAAGDCDGAVSDLEEASVADPRHVDALVDLLGRLVNPSAGQGPGSPADPSVGSRALDARAMRLIELLIRSQRPDDARRELEHLLARNPDHPEGLRAAASIAVLESKWDQAVEIYGKLLPIVVRGDRAELLRVVEDMADACERGARLADAREAIEGALALVPQDAGLMQRLERIYEGLGDWTRLAVLLTSRAELQADAGEKTRLLLLAGKLLLEDAREPAAALDVIERARAASPEGIEAALLWARAKMALGRPHEALAVLHEAAGRTRGKRSALLAFVNLEIGKAHLSQDELLEAFDALKAGFSLNGRVCAMAMMLGLVAIDLGEMQVAERALSAVTTMPSRSDAAPEGADPPSRVIAYFHLASIAYEKGDIGRARRLATKAVTGDPDHVAARALLARLEVRSASARAPT